jgi:hypothetical protein
LNLVTIVDKYPIPNVQDFSARLHGCRVFSKLDLKKGYQVKVTDGGHNSLRAVKVPQDAV